MMTTIISCPSSVLTRLKRASSKGFKPKLTNVMSEYVNFTGTMGLMRFSQRERVSVCVCRADGV